MNTTALNTPQDARDHEESVKVYLNLTNVVNTPERKGRGEGLEEGLQQGREEGVLQKKLNTARKMRKMGMTTDMISQVAGLTAGQIELL